MARTFQIAGAVALLCLAWVFIEAALTVRVVREETARVSALAQVEVSLTREALLAEVRAARGDAFEEISAARRQLLAEVRAVRGDSVALIDKHATTITDRVDTQILGLRAEVRDSITPVALSGVKLMETYAALPGEVRQDLRPWLDCRGNGSCWPAQITATLGSARFTLGQIARSAPRVAASLERSAEASERATDSTARAMSNVAELTRPLPRWVRIPLQIMGPTTPIWAPLIIR